MSYGGYDRGPLCNAIAWVFTGISLVTVTLRVLSRFVLTNTGGIDDVFIVIAMAFIFARAVLVSVAIDHGFGSHFDTIPTSQQDTALYWIWILEAVGVLTFCLPKPGVAALLVRLFNVKKITKILLYGSAFTLVVAGVIGAIITPYCSPVAYAWSPSSVNVKCALSTTYADYGYFLGAFSVFLDFAFALYPLVMVSKLKMKLGRKIAICLSLGLGFVAGAVTIYKNVETVGLAANAVTDPTYYSVPLEVWNSVESCTLIIAACLPTIGPTVRGFNEAYQHLTSIVTRSSAGRSTASRSQNTYSDGISDARNNGRTPRSGREQNDSVSLQPLSSGDASSMSSKRPIDEERGHGY